MSDPIDWRRIAPFEGDQRRGFEELCRLLFQRLRGAEGAYRGIDDRGGGGGVECYLVRPDGSEVGLQAKFFTERLGPAQRKQIQESIRTAVATRPRLQEFILCLPINLTDQRRSGGGSERAWWEKLVTRTLFSQRRQVVLIGRAGVGKTHLVAHAADEATAAGRPALLLLGSRFERSRSLWHQLNEQLGLGPHVAREELVAALEVAAELAGRRLPIFIDAINESEDPRLWERHLQDLLASLTRSPWLVPIVTCREAYKELLGELDVLQEYLTQQDLVLLWVWIRMRGFSPDTEDELVALREALGRDPVAVALNLEVYTGDA